MSQQPNNDDLLWFVVKTHRKTVRLLECIEKIMTDMNNDGHPEAIKSATALARIQTMNIESDIQNIIQKYTDEITTMISKSVLDGDVHVRYPRN